MVAGIHSDEAISSQKGPPMMSNEERRLADCMAVGTLGRLFNGFLFSCCSMCLVLWGY